MTTPPFSTDEQTRMILDELQAIRKSVNRVYTLLLIPIVLTAVFYAGTALRSFFP